MGEASYTVCSPVDSLMLLEYKHHGSDCALLLTRVHALLFPTTANSFNSLFVLVGFIFGYTIERFLWDPPSGS